MPYLNATQSGVVAAAFGNGRPVVASRTGGLVDAVTEDADGVLVAPGDPAALAEAIGALLDDAPRLARLGEGARRAAAGAFAWSHIADEVIAFNAAHLVRRGRSRSGVAATSADSPS